MDRSQTLSALPQRYSESRTETISLIDWFLKKQHSVSLSSTEAEHVALSEAYQELIVMRRLLASIGLPQHAATLINDKLESRILFILSKLEHQHLLTQRIVT